MYGAAALPEIDHETRVGLWLNLGRTETRRAVGMLEGMAAAMGDKVPKKFYEALAETPEEAEAHYQLDRARRAL